MDTDRARATARRRTAERPKVRLFLVVTAFMLSHLGQDCTISCNNPPAPSCLACNADQVVVCDQFCATPRKPGESCNVVDPCAKDGSGVCATRYVCVSSPTGSAGNGTCQPETVGKVCSSSKDCGSEESCRECGGTHFLCSLPLQAGLPCLPNDASHCTDCAPGLICYAPPGSSGLASLPYPGTCVLAQSSPTGGAGCTSNAQCNGCAGATCMAVVEDTALGTTGLYTVLTGDIRGGECFSCAQGLHAACSQQNPCCTTGQDCSFTDLPGIGNCCEALDWPCPGGIGDCCGGIQQCRAASAGAANTCEQCAGEGQFCKANTDCCPGGGTACVGGTCQCGGPGSKCSSKGDCCADDVCIDKFCAACPKFNSCVTNGDCCSGFECQSKACCITPASPVTCKTSADCCTGLMCDTTSHCQPPPCQPSEQGPCGSTLPCCDGLQCTRGQCCGLRGQPCNNPGPSINQQCCGNQRCQIDGRSHTGGSCQQ